MNTEAMESGHELSEQAGPDDARMETPDACAQTGGEDTAASPPDSPDEARAALELERRERQAAEERALRLRADLENFRRRSLFEAEQLRLNLIQDIVGRFLPVLDDLDRALASVGAEASPSWTAGLEMVRKRFLAVLSEQGLARMETVGQEFDPEKHEAILRVEDSEQPSNTIVEELQSGYILGTRVIRPALVKVQA